MAWPSKITAILFRDRDRGCLAGRETFKFAGIKRLKGKEQLLDQHTKGATRSFTFVLLKTLISGWKRGKIGKHRSLSSHKTSLGKYFHGQIIARHVEFVLRVEIRSLPPFPIWLSDFFSQALFSFTPMRKCQKI